MNPQFTLRPARATDAPVLAVLAAQVWLHTYALEGVSPVIADYVLHEFTPAKYATLPADPSTNVVVAQRADCLLGFATLRLGTPCPDAAQARVELQTLYVQAHFLGQGVGHALLRQAEDMAQALAQSALWLTVNAQNQSAIDFYIAHGYRKQGLHMFMLGGVDHENHVMVGSSR